MRGVPTDPWIPYHEPLRTTLLRTGLIALAIGAALASAFGGLARWPLATLVALWPSLGGHFVELGFLNYLRPRLPRPRPAQVAARVAVWFLAGIALAYAMSLTATILAARPAYWPPWWLAGLAFIGIELIAHLASTSAAAPASTTAADRSECHVLDSTA